MNKDLLREKLQNIIRPVLYDMPLHKAIKQVLLLIDSEKEDVYIKTIEGVKKRIDNGEMESIIIKDKERKLKDRMNNVLRKLR